MSKRCSFERQHAVTTNTGISSMSANFALGSPRVGKPVELYTFNFSSLRRVSTGSTPLSPEKDLTSPA